MCENVKEYITNCEHLGKLERLQKQGRRDGEGDGYSTWENVGDYGKI